MVESTEVNTRRHRGTLLAILDHVDQADQEKLLFDTMPIAEVSWSILERLAGVNFDDLYG